MAESLYLLQITVLDIEPRIWRRVLVSSAVTMADLHDIIQDVMGWEDCHLHDFQVAGEHFGLKDEDADLPWETHDEQRHELGALVEQGDRFSYHYDFGDDWQHELVVERVLKKPKGMVVKRAVCLDGARACPPEDCGGPSGYQELLRVLADKQDPEHRTMRQWAGDWDADLFDVDGINRAVAGGRRR